jgi:hypothetical protein
MAKYPTKKSRMIAFFGTILVAVALVLRAWFSPPLPPISISIFVFTAIVLWEVAKRTREAGGVQIPEGVAKKGAFIANAEVLLSLICGLSVCVNLGLFGASKLYERTATIVTLCLFAFTAVAFRFTRARFDALMRAAGVDPAGR